jgi:hypothetical protein
MRYADTSPQTAHAATAARLDAAQFSQATSTSISTSIIGQFLGLGGIDQRSDDHWRFAMRFEQRKLLSQQGLRHSHSSE